MYRTYQRHQKKYRELLYDIILTRSLNLEKIMNMSVYDRWYTSVTEEYVGIEQIMEIPKGRWDTENHRSNIVPQTTHYIATTGDFLVNVFVTIIPFVNAC